MWLAQPVQPCWVPLPLQRELALVHRSLGTTTVVLGG